MSRSNNVFYFYLNIVFCRYLVSCYILKWLNVVLCLYILDDVSSLSEIQQHYMFSHALIEKKAKRIFEKLVYYLF